MGTGTHTQELWTAKPLIQSQGTELLIFIFFCYIQNLLPGIKGVISIAYSEVRWTWSLTQRCWEGEWLDGYGLTLILAWLLCFLIWSDGNKRSQTPTATVGWFCRHFFPTDVLFSEPCTNTKPSPLKLDMLAFDCSHEKRDSRSRLPLTYLSTDQYLCPTVSFCCNLQEATFLEQTLFSPVDVNCIQLSVSVGVSAPLSSMLTSLVYSGLVQAAMTAVCTWVWWSCDTQKTLSQQSLPILTSGLYSLSPLSFMTFPGRGHGGDTCLGSGIPQSLHIYSLFFPHLFLSGKKYEIK